MKNLLNLLFPKLCLGCKQLLVFNETVICIACRHHIPYTNHLIIRENETFKKFYGKIPVEHASSIAYFHKKGIVQQLIHQLKYKGKQEIGTFFGSAYAEDLKNSNCLNNIDCIIPVPLHPRKLRERGYNQVAFFGKSLAQGLNIPYNEKLLLRKQYAKTQTTKSIFGRTELLADAFELKNPEAHHGKHFLLVDDVITTGSTLEACGKILLKIPGTKISIVTIGYAN